jgi:hypothetical protein
MVQEFKIKSYSAANLFKVADEKMFDVFEVKQGKNSYVFARKELVFWGYTSLDERDGWVLCQGSVPDIISKIKEGGRQKLPQNEEWIMERGKSLSNNLKKILISQKWDINIKGSPLEAEMIRENLFLAVSFEEDSVSSLGHEPNSRHVYMSWGEANAEFPAGAIVEWPTGDWGQWEVPEPPNCELTERDPEDLDPWNY